MAVDPITLALLAAPVVRLVFERVLKNRSIRFGDLIKQVEQVDPNVDRRQAKATLDQLQNAHLIKEKGSALEDFNTYYVTADGLEASRKAGIRS